MSGVVGSLDKIVALKEKYTFRVLADDAHGLGTMANRLRRTRTFLAFRKALTYTSTLPNQWR
jgi:7-keto-8-aminopelargonate synthetase-like enzyme